MNFSEDFSTLTWEKAKSTLTSAAKVYLWILPFPIEINVEKFAVQILTKSTPVGADLQ